jgi:hypothetical protein
MRSLRIRAATSWFPRSEPRLWLGAPRRKSLRSDTARSTSGSHDVPTRLEGLRVGTSFACSDRTAQGWGRRSATHGCRVVVDDRGSERPLISGGIYVMGAKTAVRTVIFLPDVDSLPDEHPLRPPDERTMCPSHTHHRHSRLKHADSAVSPSRATKQPSAP